jgi:hypothetical protein
LTAKPAPGRASQRPRNDARTKDEAPKSLTETAEDGQIAPEKSRSEAGHKTQGQEARGYKWADATPGNVLALKHGAYSERAIAERAQLVHASLLEVAPWCAEDRYLPSVNRYLQATARETLAHDALMAGGKLSPRLLETATAAARLAWSMGDALGLTPAGHARLKLLVAGATEAEASLRDMAQQGRQTRGRQAALAEGEPFDGGGDDAA